MSIDDHIIPSGQEIPSNKVHIRGPWSPQTRTKILLLCQGASEDAVVATLEAIFSSTVQNFEITCVAPASTVLAPIRTWMETDSRVNFAEFLPESLPNTGAILVLRAGWVLTPFSIEALWESLELPGVRVLRSVAEGASGTLEFWNAEWLAGCGSRSDAEAQARRLGVERWISAEGAGIHSYDRPAPRVFYRRGAADRHVVDVVVFDAGSNKFRAAKDREIAELKREIRELKKVAASPGKARPALLRKIVTRIRRLLGRTR